MQNVRAVLICIPILLGSKYGHFTNKTTTILTFTAIIKSIQRFTIPNVTYKMKALLLRGLNIGCPIQIVEKTLRSDDVNKFD